MAKSRDGVGVTMRMLICALLLLCSPLFCSFAEAGVVSGSFLYEQEGDGSMVRYQVAPADYQGQAAWRISWECAQLSAEHYVRQSDGAPLYVKRVNHALKRTVEILYSQQAGVPTIYRKRTAQASVECKIDASNLRDLGSLPQVLAELRDRSGDDDELGFQAINYDDGKVYPLIAKPAGFRRVAGDSGSVRCLIYNIQLDSWLASLPGTTRLLLPVAPEAVNFMAYSGPGLDSVSDNWELKLVSRDTRVAMVAHDPVQP